MKSSTYSHRRQNARIYTNSGFTLLEILTAAAMALLVLGTIVAGLTKGTESSKAAAVASALHNVKTGVKQFADEHGGWVPITESTVAGSIPVSGEAAIAVASKAATFDNVLLTERALDRALQIGVGPNPPATGSVELPWNSVAQNFTVGDAPTRDYSLCNRVEVALVSHAATPLEAAPLGSQFYLDGVNGLPAGKKAIYVAIPRCPGSLAYKISKAIDGDRFSTSPSLADPNGAVIYTTPVNGATDVAIHVMDL
jgi:type II secretory pathway pseudopilin PulG